MHLAAAPRQTPGTDYVSVRAGRARQIAPAGLIFAGTIRHGRTVFGDDVGDSRIHKQPRAVAVVAGHVAEFVNVAALAAADARRPRRIEFMRVGHEFLQKIPHLRHHGPVAEKHLVVHAPDDDARMIAVDADHVAQAGLHARFKIRRRPPGSSDRRWQPTDS